MTILTPKDVQTNSFFGNFDHQPIPPDYYYSLNDDDDNDDDNGNIIPGTPVDDVFLENEGVEDATVTKDEDIDNEKIVDDDDSLTSSIDPLQNQIPETEEVDTDNEGGEIEGEDAENEGVD